MFYETAEEFEKARMMDAGSSVEKLFDLLTNREDRTLVFGYDLDRNSVHIYMMGGVVHYLVYNENHHYVDGKWTETDYDILHETKDFSKVDMIEYILPSKRIYPESVDKEFMEKILIPQRAGNFTTFDPQRAEKVKGRKFHGFTKYIL